MHSFKKKLFPFPKFDSVITFIFELWLENFKRQCLWFTIGCRMKQFQSNPTAQMICGDGSGGFIVPGVILCRGYYTSLTKVAEESYVCKPTNVRFNVTWVPPLVYSGPTPSHFQSESATSTPIGAPGVWGVVIIEGPTIERVELPLFYSLSLIYLTLGPN